MRAKQTRSLVVFLATVAISLGFSWLAKADVEFLDKKPAGEIKTIDAAKRAAKNEETWQCDQVRMGPAINPVKVSGSKSTFHSSVGKGLENAEDALSSGKTLFKCQTIAVDSSTGRVRKLK